MKLLLQSSLVTLWICVRKETNDWKKNKERDLCCENKEGNIIKMESRGQQGVEGAFMQYHSLSMTWRIVTIRRRKESLVIGPQQENTDIASPTVLPRERTGHSKHPLPTTQEKTLHMDIMRWSIPKSDWLYSLQTKMEKLYIVSKNKTRSWLWLRSWTPYCQTLT